MPPSTVVPNARKVVFCLCVLLLCSMSRSTNVSVQSDSLDVSPMFFENISLLGFNAVAMTKKYRIPFDR